ncbi:MAG TPA: hypothetical protein VKB36_19525, partial [Vicinamibacterales bacterium]|nr:hypothetical protein [Vicinamibacterales bacterium]
MTLGGVHEAAGRFPTNGRLMWTSGGMGRTGRNGYDQQMPIRDIIIVGAGPSGLAAAIHAKQ